jgi:Cysteine rich repeat
MKRHHIAALVCAAVLPYSAHAQQPPLQGLPPEASNPAVQAAWSACNGDIQRYCPDVQPGGGRIVRCLVFNLTSLTLACRSGMLTAKSALGR